ncbi:unnamed protein product [Closterium sp. Yama58-4]|nr:unnamed protein product [Closterium sp. Yama58-4]
MDWPRWKPRPGPRPPRSPPPPRARLNTRAPHVRAFAAMLSRQQRRVAQDISLPAPHFLHSYTHTSNGFSALLTPEQLQKLKKHHLVADIRPSVLIKKLTTDSPRFLKLPGSLWRAGGGRKRAGAGVVIGVVDTGIWPEHPSFRKNVSCWWGVVLHLWCGEDSVGAAVVCDSYSLNLLLTLFRSLSLPFSCPLPCSPFLLSSAHPPYSHPLNSAHPLPLPSHLIGPARVHTHPTSRGAPPSSSARASSLSPSLPPTYPPLQRSSSPTDRPPHWSGTCARTSDFKGCSSKLIGARFFLAGFAASGFSISPTADYLSPRDTNGHGTWCAGAAAGRLGVIVRPPLRTSPGAASGMAPGAHLAVYKVFWQEAQSGALFATTADVEMAVAAAAAAAAVSSLPQPALPFPRPILPAVPPSDPLPRPNRAAAGRHGVIVRPPWRPSPGAASGMAPGAHLAVYKVFWQEAQSGALFATTADVEAAVDAAVADGVDVLSLSLGALDPSATYFTDLTYLYAHAVSLSASLPLRLDDSPALYCSGVLFVLFLRHRRNSLSLSLGALDPSATYFTDLTFLYAHAAGTVVAFAAGNEGLPGSGYEMYRTINNFSPFYLTVGAGDDAACSGSQAADIAKAVVLLPSSTAPAASTATAVALSRLNESASSDATAAAAAAAAAAGGAGMGGDDGATAAVAAGTSRSIPSSPGTPSKSSRPSSRPSRPVFVDLYSLPLLRLDTRSAALLHRFLQGTRTRATAAIIASIHSITKMAPTVPYFSSTGPLAPADDAPSPPYPTNDILKPDILAPGVNLWSAAPGKRGLIFRRAAFVRMSGTSMATPHIAGIAALLMQRWPAWSPAQIMSAIMTTASTRNNKGGKIRGSTGGHATPWEIGSGQVNPPKLLDPGLTYDITLGDFKDFLAGQNETTAKLEWPSDTLTPTPAYNLNRPSISVSRLSGSVTVTRYVTSVYSETTVYTAVVEAPAGVSINVDPGDFTIAAGETVSYKVYIQNSSIADLPNAYTTAAHHIWCAASSCAPRVVVRAVSFCKFPLSRISVAVRCNCRQHSSSDLLALSDAHLLQQCDVDTYRASGPGGQHRNKTESAVRIRHKPTGCVAQSCEQRSQHMNKATALVRLRQAIALTVRTPIHLPSYEPSLDLLRILPRSASKPSKPQQQKQQQQPSEANAATAATSTLAEGGSVGGDNAAASSSGGGGTGGGAGASWSGSGSKAAAAARKVKDRIGPNHADFHKVSDDTPSTLTTTELWDISKQAATLGISTGALSKLLLSDRGLLQRANELRAAKGLKPLR